jgi:hypothetical protein
MKVKIKRLNRGVCKNCQQREVEIKYLKEQLLRVGNNDGAFKAAYLAGQMSVKRNKGNGA